MARGRTGSLAWLVALASLIAFIALLVNFPKATLGTVAVVVGVVGLWYASLNQEQRERDAEKALVEIALAYDEETCSESYPLRVDVTNRTSRTVNSVD